MNATRSVPTRSGHASGTAAAKESAVRTYVLDTSVLLSDPWAVTRFAEHEVVDAVPAPVRREPVEPVPHPSARSINPSNDWTTGAPAAANAAGSA